MNLTPAQQRLIDDARLRDDYRVNFFGIPEKTKQKLIDAGLVETVPDITSDEDAALRSEISKLCYELVAYLVERAPSYHTQRISREISYKTSRLFTTKNVLTASAKENNNE